MVKIAKFKIALGILFTACTLLTITGCIGARPLSRKFKLPIQNFNVSNQSFYETNKEWDYKFNAYAKECSIGVYQSAGKLITLYNSTLEPNSPNYLYFQQSSFSTIYELCLTYLNDYLTQVENAKKREKPISVEKHLLDEEKNNEIKKYVEAINNSIPKDINTIHNYIFYYTIHNDLSSANYWRRTANVLQRSDIIETYYLGKFFFDHEETKVKGYKMIEVAALQGYKTAIETLDRPKYVSFRIEHPEFLDNYRKIQDL